MSLPERYSDHVHTAPPEQTAREAARRMRDLHVGVLVVVDDRRRPVGVVTDRDLALHVLAGRHDAGLVPLRDCMTVPAITLGREATLRDASDAMRRHRVKRLPIVDADGRAVGLVSADDLVDEFGEQVHRLARAMRRGFDNEGREDAAASAVFGRE